MFREVKLRVRRQRRGLKNVGAGHRRPEKQHVSRASAERGRATLLGVNPLLLYYCTWKL